jgi:hypothetical protein
MSIKSVILKHSIFHYTFLFLVLISCKDQPLSGKENKKSIEFNPDSVTLPS